MKEYSVPGFKMSFPENFKRKGDFPYVDIIKLQNYPKEKISIRLLSRRTNFEDELKLRLDPALIGNERRTRPVKLNIVIRAGDFQAFPGAKERLNRKRFDCGPVIEYYWKILIPVTSRTVEILVAVTQRDIGRADYDQEGADYDQEGLDELENTWRPIIDSMEFDHSVIADLPDIFEMVKNYPKTAYTDNGLKLSYPAILKEKGNPFNLVLNNPITGNNLKIFLSEGDGKERGSFIDSIVLSFFSVIISMIELIFNCFPTGKGKKVKLFQRIKMVFLSKIYDTKCWYNNIGINPKTTPLYYNDDRGWRIENIREGNYPKFLGAEEQLERIVRSSGGVLCIWKVLIPVGKRVIKVTAMNDDLSEIEDVWQPIVESIEFDLDVMKQLPNVHGVTRFSWMESAPDQSQHVYYEAYIDFTHVSLYDSQNEISPDSFWDRLDEMRGRGFLKISNRLMLETYQDLIRLPMDFYLNTDAPDEKDPDWDHIIEGLIDLESGKMSVGTLNWDYYGVPYMELLLPVGVYKFRVYFGGWKLTEFFETDEEHWQIYFWPTDEKETNEIKIIKPWNKPKFDD